MPSGKKNMDNNSYEQLLIMQATIDANRQYSDEKTKRLTENLTEIISSMMDQIKISKESTGNKDSPKAQDHTTAVPANNNDPPLEGGNSTKMVSYGLSNMIPDLQNSMNYLSRQN